MQKLTSTKEVSYEWYHRGYCARVSLNAHSELIWNSKDFIADYKSSLNYHFFLISNLTGLDSEGIYRISGFADDIESLKNSFDKGKVQVIVFKTVSYSNHYQYNSQLFC